MTTLKYAPIWDGYGRGGREIAKIPLPITPLADNFESPWAIRELLSALL